MVNVYDRAVVELDRWDPLGVPVEEKQKMCEAALFLAKAMAEVFTEDVKYNMMLVTLVQNALYNLLSPLQPADFDSDGACERATTAYKKDGKYYFSFGRVYVHGALVDKERPQSHIEFVVPGMPPKPKVFYVYDHCGACAKPGSECASCPNVKRIQDDTEPNE